MKFGKTFAQRSVPEWATFNLDYNFLKAYIKERTSATLEGPVYIPQPGKSRWQELDTAFFKLLTEYYENIALFLRMKNGEIDRRLRTLTKDVASARAMVVKVTEEALDIDIVASIQGRRFRRITKQTEELVDLIQKVARYTSAQKIAFRKLVKKYTKWTGSRNQQTRLDREVFASNPPKTDYSEYLEQLANIQTIISQELAIPMLRRQELERQALEKQKQWLMTTPSTRSLIAEIDASIPKGPSAFDAAIIAVPYGQVAGSAVYWIHPDNLDEVRALLHKNMKRHGSAPSSPARRMSKASLQLMAESLPPHISCHTLTSVVFFDNAQRYVADNTSARPSKVALSAYWSSDEDAAITLASLSPISSAEQTILLDEEDLYAALDRDKETTNPSTEVETVQKYLREHRDVKPLAAVQSHRTRYSGINNTAEIASWATLDTNITVTSVDIRTVGEWPRSIMPGEDFPHAVLYIRWEFARIPPVVRAFDESHLAFRVETFSIEDMAIRKVQKDLPETFWEHTLKTDITTSTLPPLIPRTRFRRALRARMNPDEFAGTSSGPSSNEGPAESIFSLYTHGNSSITSEETRAFNISSAEESTPTYDQKPNKKPHQKRARLVVPEPKPQPRYWNEYDDGDSDVNPQDEYAIYVDPDAPAFPAISKTWAAIKASWPFNHTTDGNKYPNERTPLVMEIDEESASVETSDSDSFGLQRQKQLSRGLVWGLVGGIGVTFLIGVVVLTLCIMSLE